MPSRGLRLALLALALIASTTVAGTALVASTARADPTVITASDFRLEEGPYNPVISALDGVLPAASVPAVLDSANRSATTSGCDPAADHQVAAFCWEVGDNTTKDWYPQGISSTADAYGSGTYEGRTALFVSWYYNGTGTNKGVRMSFVDYENPAAPRYRHVLLVQPHTDSAGRPDFRPVTVHAGGIFGYGHYLYVADTWGGFRAFDLRHIWRVSTGDKSKVGRQADGTYHAFNYRYVLPQAQRFTPPQRVARRGYGSRRPRLTAPAPRTAS